MYDEICAVIAADEGIRSMIQEALISLPSCYPDPEMKTATIDVGFYLARYYLEARKSEREKAEWFPRDYSPGLSVDDWIELLNDSSVFTTGSLQIMKRIKDYGGQATCTQLSSKYGGTKNFYNAVSSSLAKRVAMKTGCAVMEDNIEDSKWWPILYVGRRTSKEEQGSYFWKLRDELSAAIDKIDLSGVELYVNTGPDIREDNPLKQPDAIVQKYTKADFR